MREAYSILSYAELEELEKMTLEEVIARYKANEKIKNEHI